MFTSVGVIFILLFSRNGMVELEILCECRYVCM